MGWGAQETQTESEDEVVLQAPGEWVWSGGVAPSLERASPNISSSSEHGAFSFEKWAESQNGHFCSYRPVQLQQRWQW